MKITAGLGALEGYQPLCEAGADEVFCGFVPFSWLEQFGAFAPINRREVVFPPMQISTFQDMKLLSRQREAADVPVTITLNALTYAPEMYPYLADYVRQLLDIGFSSYIIADLALLVYLREHHVDVKAHISGEMGEVNGTALKECVQLGATRLIFHRKVTTAQMGSLTAAVPGLEYEAFALNEKCHYTGAHCFSLHCDQLPPICRLPYQLMPLEENEPVPQKTLPDEADSSCLGATGCALCRLPCLRSVGITHLKVVGRGNSLDNMVRDVKAIKKAALLAEGGATEDEIRQTFFENGCPGNCYYPLREEV